MTLDSSRSDRHWATYISAMSLTIFPSIASTCIICIYMNFLSADDHRLNAVSYVHNNADRRMPGPIPQSHL